MTPSERLELAVFHFAERGGKAQWQSAMIATVSAAADVTDWPVVADALHDLHARNYLAVRRWDRSKSSWLVYDGGNVEYFYKEFSMKVTFSGRKYFESLEARSSEPPLFNVLLENPTQHRGEASVGLPSGANVFPKSVATPQSHHPRAFVSHSSQDRAFVEHFATDLRSRGVDAWYSGWEIRPGDSIRGKIDEGLAGCDHFLIVLSKDSINRPWVQTELDAATVRRIAGKVKKIIPVKIEDCGELPPTLGALCWEDFSNQTYDLALKRILDSIFDHDVRPPLGKAPAISSKRPIPQIQAERPQTHFPISINTVADFAKQLQGERFDARSDLFNGQVGLIVGPRGLDPSRLRSDLSGFFFPLWELNHESNRALVADRKFHDLFERRSADWQYNRPYQQGERAVEPSQRHWSRSASLLGSKPLEDQVQRELAMRFTPTTYPVNIDVVGGQGTYAVVQINNFGEINEMEKAIPEDYIDRGGMLAAVIAVTEQVLTQLLNSGRLDIR